MNKKMLILLWICTTAMSLRDARSATKSITDVLVGIAIQEGKLSGVDARVLTLPGIVKSCSTSLTARPLTDVLLLHD